MFVLHFLCCNVQQSRGLETGLSPVQGVLPNVKLIHNSISNSGLEQITRANPYTWWWHGGFTSFRAWVCVTEVRVASGNSLTSRFWGQVFTFPGDEYVIRFELQAPYRWCQLECSKYRSVPCKETFNHLCKGSTCGNNSTKDVVQFRKPWIFPHTTFSNTSPDRCMRATHYPTRWPVTGMIKTCTEFKLQFL
jgi:hypothetical protein